jgi:hypothetical protein
MPGKASSERKNSKATFETNNPDLHFLASLDNSSAIRGQHLTETLTFNLRCKLWFGKFLV